MKHLDKKRLYVTNGLIQSWISEALKYNSSLNYKEIKVGDWVYEVSTIHGGPRSKRVGWSGIGKLIKSGNLEGDGWKIRALSGKIENWNNANFFRLPEEVQEHLALFK